VSDLARQERGPGRGGFRVDLAEAFRAWRSAPALPVVSALVWGVPSIGITSDWYALAVAPLVLLLPGWAGAERVWYLRAFEGAPFPARTARRLTLAFLGRYLVLGLVAFLPVALVATAVASTSGDTALLVGVLTVGTLVVDVALTFVTPALAFSTRSVREALRRGIATIWESWPASAPYVLVPPLAVQVVARSLAGREGGWTLAAASVFLPVLMTSLFRGATARFHLRRHPAGLDGAAFLPRFAELSSDDPWEDDALDDA
jgi:hypothetical protein